MGTGDRKEKSTGRIPTGQLGKLTAQAAREGDVVELQPDDRKTAQMEPGQFRELLAAGRADPADARTRAKTVEDSATTAAILAEIGRPRRRNEALAKPDAMPVGSSPEVPMVTLAPRAPVEVDTAQLYPMAPRSDARLAIVVALVILGVVAALVAVALR